MGYFRKTLRPTSEMLSKLPLKSGCNNITFTVSSTLQGTQSVSACIFLWDNTTKIVISDVDGTITKSDVMGHVAPLIVGSQWSHNGVAQLFTNIQNNGYRMLYLTSRGIGQSSVTRSYLFENVKQRNFSLPFGPIIMSPDSLTTAFYREVIVKKPHEFKIPALSNIQSLFNKTHNPFYAGFGNRSSDLYSYLEVGVPKNRIFIIKPSGKINTNNKLFKTTYDTLNIDIDQMFMNRKNKKSNELEEFNSHNYWNNNYYENVQLTDIDESNDSDNEIKEKPINNKNKKNMDISEDTMSGISSKRGNKRNKRKSKNDKRDKYININEEERNVSQVKNLFTKAINNRHSGVEEMLASNTDPNTKDEHGNTILHVAAQNGNKRLIKIALRWGGRINEQNKQGQTALHYLFAYKYENLAAYLISKGADDTIQNEFGYTCYDGLRPSQ
eukprot:112712_1